MQTFERITLLSPHDLDAYALSLAASEVAMDADNDAESITLILMAKKLRRLEQAQAHEGESSALLDELQLLANLQDDWEDEFKAFQAIREAISNYAALETV